MAKILKFSVKVGILGGAVYYSKLIGVWDDSITTNKLLSDSMKAVYPYIYTVEERLPVEIKNLPSRDEMYTSTINCWNHGVISSISFLRSIPSYIVKYSKVGTSYVQKQFEQERTTLQSRKQDEKS